MGPNHPTVAFQWLNLASLHLGLGDYQLAEKEFQHTLTIAEKLLEPYDRVKAAALNNLGWLYISTKDYDRAERCALESLKIYEETRGPEHPGVVSPLMNLGVIARAKKGVCKGVGVLLPGFDRLREDLGIGTSQCRKPAKQHRKYS